MVKPRRFIDSDGVLFQADVDKRSYLHCLYGYGLILWWMKLSEDAEEVFERMFWLNPDGNQVVGFLIHEVRKRKP